MSNAALDTMIERQLKDRGIRDPRVLQAMRDIPREDFVPGELREEAYEDAPLPIGEGQTISQPYTVAFMTELLELRKTDKVLEVGTGSGYQTAILCALAAEVYSIEREASLLEKADCALARLGVSNVHLRRGDGTQGWSEAAPFDAILVAAATPQIPQPLKSQLAVGGRLVLPVGSKAEQELIRLRRTGERDFSEEYWGEFRFVPLIGEFGWKDN